MQPGYATPWLQGKREPMAPTAARIIAAGEPDREPVPESVEVPRCRMTRHADDGGSFDHSRRSWGISPGRPLAVTLIRAELGEIPFQPGSPGSVRMSASFAAKGYKMYLSRGFLFRAAGLTRVQNVLFAGVLYRRSGTSRATKVLAGSVL